MSLENDRYDQIQIETAEWEGMGTGFAEAKAKENYGKLVELLPYEEWIVLQDKPVLEPANSDG